MKTFFFVGDRLKNFCEDLFFFGEHLRLCPWSLALASSIPVLGLESVCPRKGCPWPRIFFLSLALALASSLVSSTPPLTTIIVVVAYSMSLFLIKLNFRKQIFIFLSLNIKNSGSIKNHLKMLHYFLFYCIRF